MFLPHPNDWHAAVHIVPVRIGELGLAQSYEYKTAPYDRTFRLAFELDEMRGTGEIVIRTRDSLCTGVRRSRCADGRVKAVPL